ncbi:hypothetical protein T484DRAFT_2587517 [Baffinella frigidus]|nr:hypothetical protein T484DRAFT_2587517 [Cryptophyta sp. CCMP2293]
MKRVLTLPLAHPGRAKDAAAAATPPVLPEAGRSVEPFSSGASLPPEAGPSRRISSDAASSALRAISAMVGGRGAAGAAGGGGAQPLLAAHSSAASSAATGAAPEATPGPLGVVVTPDGRASISPTLVQREPSVSGKGETETWDTTLDVTDRSRPLLVCLAALPGFKWDAVADEMIEVTCSCGELPSGDKEGGKGAGGSSANGSNGTNCSKSSNGVNGSKSLTRERPSLILDARELLEGGAADLQGGVTLTLRFRLSKLE